MLPYKKWLSEIDALVNNDWGFEVVDEMNMPNARPFSQEQAKEMSRVLGKIYSISHRISCKACSR